MLTESQLGQMRRDADRLLPDTATVYRRTLVDDGVGGKKADYGNPIATVKCRFGALDVKTRIKDQATGGRIQANEGFLGSFPHDADLIETDRVVIKGSTYDLISAGDERSFQVNKRFILKRVG